jgi:hypothetical protein
MIMVDQLYNFLFYNYSLWKFDSSAVNHTFADLLVAFIAFPSAVLLFLTRLPKRKWKLILYILGWTLFFTGIEIVSHLRKQILYEHGWNTWYSLLFDAVMFTVLAMHHRENKWTYLLCIVFILLFLIKFPIPLSSMK